MPPVKQVNRDRARSTHEKGRDFEKKVARWAASTFGGSIKTNEMVYGLKSKRPYEIDIHVSWREGTIRKKQRDLWIECKDIKSTIKRDQIFKLEGVWQDIYDAAKAGKEDFWFDCVAIASTSPFDHDALSLATDYSIACIHYDGRRYHFLNKVEWIPSELVVEIS